MKDYRTIVCVTDCILPYVVLKGISITGSLLEVLPLRSSVLLVKQSKSSCCLVGFKVGLDFTT